MVWRRIKFKEVKNEAIRILSNAIDDYCFGWHNLDYLNVK